MSFHVYREAQRCPLSVALKRSTYRQLWEGSGYPTRPNAAAVSGIVVHEAAEAIMKKFAQAGVTSLMQPAAMTILRELGGFTKVLDNALIEFFTGQANNPRFEQFREDLLRSLRLRLPQMRATLQALLVSHVWPVSSSSIESPRKMNNNPGQGKSTQRSPLWDGTFVEVDLQDPVAKWRGRIDIMDIDEHGCAITDLKSGVATDDHQEQLIVYAMLWREDFDRNPSRLPIQKLQIIYASGAVTVAVPSDPQMQAFRRGLIDATELVRSTLNATAVPANPSRENCRHCPVKLICQPYWESLPREASDDHLSSNQVTLIEARGDRAWLAKITASSVLEANQKVVVRNYEGGKAFWEEMKPGLSVRLTDGVLSSFDESNIPVINLSMMSEAVFLNEPVNSAPYPELPARTKSSST
jgi:CRISPR/Cas system-associated exonuclease Cas4 (RecB family)